MIDFDTPKNVEDLGKLILAKSFQSCPKSNNSPNLVTLTMMPVRSKPLEGLLVSLKCTQQICRLGKK